MKTTLIALSVFALSSNAMASSANYNFVALDDSAQTKLCVVSAKAGLKAAKKTAGVSFDPNIICNGTAITKFAAKYQTPLTVKVVAANNSVESELCVNAVVNGVNSLNLKKSEISQISCNGLNLTAFARTYAAK
ncbi:hypothetical protein QX776_03270 [Alteromonadaceae bacterium BrNp21-10]|nr:hypothetical protein [Alteromonadaceae bacterium BrNp21-10]